MALESLTDLLIKELADLYDAERQLLKALPEMAEKCFSPELQELITEHTEQTKGHVTRLKEIFSLLSVSPPQISCPAMGGLIEEAQELLEQEGEADPAVLDAALIAAAQKIEHYEIAGYGSARTFARTLGATEVARLLQTTLEEEALTDRKLTAAAEGAINPDAAETDAEAVREAR